MGGNNTSVDFIVVNDSDLPVVEAKREWRLPVDAASVAALPDTIQSAQISTKAGVWKVNVGQVTPSRAGGTVVFRILGIDEKAAIYYLEGGQFYYSNIVDYHQHIWMEAFQTGASWARGGAILAQMQVEFALSFISAGAGGFVGGTITAVRVMELLSEADVRMILKLVRHLPALLQARKIIKTHAPRLYSLVMSAFLDKLLEGLAETAVGVALARFMGAVSAKIGLHKVGELVKTLAGIVMYVLIYLTSIIGKAAGVAVEMTKEDIQANVELLKAMMSNISINLSQRDAEAIVLETGQNFQRLYDATVLLQNAFSDAPAKSTTASQPSTAPAPRQGNRGEVAGTVQTRTVNRVETGQVSAVVDPNTGRVTSVRYK